MNFSYCFINKQSDEYFMGLYGTEDDWTDDNEYALYNTEEKMNLLMRDYLSNHPNKDPYNYQVILCYGDEIENKKTKQKYGRLRTDNCGHYYLVPEDEVIDFANFLEDVLGYDGDSSDERDDLEDKFLARFDKYRLSGGYQDLKIVMEDKQYE